MAEYWKQHYDLDYIMQRDWKTLGPKLIGKLHFAVGDNDSYYLDRAVRLTEKFLETTKEPGKGPYYAGDFDYGHLQPHGYNRRSQNSPEQSLHDIDVGVDVEDGAGGGGCEELALLTASRHQHDGRSLTTFGETQTAGDCREALRRGGVTIAGSISGAPTARIRRSGEARAAKKRPLRAHLAWPCGAP
ncbi:MAG: hypothetical protein WDO73_23180 [Ignavibacteriota bacterium]